MEIRSSTPTPVLSSFRYVHDQPQIPFDQLASRFCISLFSEHCKHNCWKRGASSMSTSSAGGCHVVSGSCGAEGDAVEFHRKFPAWPGEDEAGGLVIGTHPDAGTLQPFSFSDFSRSGISVTSITRQSSPSTASLPASFTWKSTGRKTSCFSGTGSWNGSSRAAGSGFASFFFAMARSSRAVSAPGVTQTC